MVRRSRAAGMGEAGTGHILVARRWSSGALGRAFFIVGLFCLGVRGVFYRESEPSGLGAHMARLDELERGAAPIDPASAKAVIRGAVAFAAACVSGPRAGRPVHPRRRGGGGGDGWNLDPIRGEPTAERLALRGLVERLGGATEGGPVIAREGPTDAVDGTAAEQDPSQGA